MIHTRNKQARLAALRARAEKKRRAKGDLEGLTFEDKKKVQRELEVKIFRREMYRAGWGNISSGYMSKEEAREMLDRRDADPIYRRVAHPCHVFMHECMYVCTQWVSEREDG
jgi:hypothetical protein